MTTYTYSEARQRLSSLLEKAQKEGRVLIRRKDGLVFLVQPLQREGSPLCVQGVDIDLSADEIVDILREIRGTRRMDATGIRER